MNHKNNQNAFTLIELLVVISIITLLMSVVMPAMSSARKSAKQSSCKSNIRQVAIAVNLYAHDNDGNFILAASDIYMSPGNRSRWHGTRKSLDEPFDFAQSDLYPYLGTEGIKECPEKVAFVQKQPWDMDFEQGGGGYGYNMTYIGSRIWQGGFNAYGKPTKENEVRNPGQTIFFADAAMAKLSGKTPYYLEYSFVEPPFFVMGAAIQKSMGYSSPSMHFRHKGQANIAWVDGHASSEAMAPFERANVYGVKSAEMMLGWPELDNNLFDLK